LVHHVNQGAAGALQVRGKQGQDAKLFRGAIESIKAPEKAFLVKGGISHVMPGRGSGCGAAALEDHLGLHPMVKDNVRFEEFHRQKGDLFNGSNLYRVHPQCHQVVTVYRDRSGLKIKNLQGSLPEGSVIVNLKYILLKSLVHISISLNSHSRQASLLVLQYAFEVRTRKYTGDKITGDLRVVIL
jgi:hypothetical protein